MPKEKTKKATALDAEPENVNHAPAKQTKQAVSFDFLAYKRTSRAIIAPVRPLVAVP